MPSGFCRTRAWGSGVGGLVLNEGLNLGRCGLSLWGSGVGASD